MAGRELKKLSRMELIDLIYELRLQNDELEQKLAESNQKLREREITISNAGSIADAAISLNAVFEAAQNAADQYLMSVKSKCEKMEEQIRLAKDQCDKMLSDAADRAEKIVSSAENEKQAMLAAADRECEIKYARLRAQANQYIKEHPELYPLFTKKQRQE